MVFYWRDWHFVATGTEMRIVPPYIPWPRATVLVTGVCELLGAFGIVPTRSRPATRRRFVSPDPRGDTCQYLYVAALGVVPIPYWVLVARLPLQLALLAIIAWSTDINSLMKVKREPISQLP